MPSDQSQDRYFRTDHLEIDLKGRSIRSGAVTMISQICNFLLTIVSTASLARLLTPADFGLIAMVATLTEFVAQFKDLGLSQATVQKDKINHSQVSTLFWINVALSTAITLLVAALAPVIAWFYNEPRLTGITLILAGGIIFSGLGVQHQALLTRQMRFSALAATDFTAILTGIIVAIVAAWNGFGYWSLVMMQLTTTVVNTAGDWILCGWRPGLPVRNSGVRSMLVFGGNLTGFNLINYFSARLDHILIGWYWGAQQLGLYASAYKLLLLPLRQINRPVTSVAIPTLSRLQGDPERYRQYYRKGILLIVSLGMPLVAFLCIDADKAVILFLSEKWIDAIPIFQLLTPAAFILTFNVATGWVYMSLGRTDRQLRWSYVRTTVTVICYFLALQSGTLAMATAYSLSFVFTLIPGIIYCYQDSPLRLIDLGISLYQPAVASIGAAIILGASSQLLTINLNNLMGLLLDGVLYSFLYIGIWMLLPNGKQTILGIVGIVKDLKKKPQ